MATVGGFLGRVLINNTNSRVSGLRTSAACRHMDTVCMYYSLSIFMSSLLSLFFPFLPPSSISLPPMNVVVFILLHLQSHLFPLHVAIFSLPLSYCFPPSHSLFSLVVPQPPTMAMWFPSLLPTLLPSPQSPVLQRQLALHKWRPALLIRHLNRIKSQL